MVYNPITALDKTILEQYARVRKIWESKTNDSPIYQLTTPLSFLGFGAIIAGSKLSNIHLPYPGFPFGVDLVPNILGLVGIYDKSNYISSECVKERSPEKLLVKLLRLPTFLYGSVSASTGIYNLMNGMVNRSINYDDFTGYFIGGLGLLTVASSMYLKEADPKILKKQPSKIKELVESLLNKIRAPVPKPATVPEPLPQTASDELISNLYSV
jgi:hypothetical protein